MLSDFPELTHLNAKLYLFDDGVISNGEVTVKLNSRLSVLAKHTVNDPGKILLYVPANASYFEKYKVDNLLNYIEHQLENRSDELSNATISIIRNLGNEWVKVKYNDSNTTNLIFIIEDANQIEKYLDVKSNEIQQLENTELLKALDLIDNLQQSYYYKAYNNALVIGSNEKAINVLISDVKQKGNFSSNKAYQQYESKLYTNNFCIMYSNSVNASLKNNFGPVFHQLFTIDEAIFCNTILGYKNEGLTNKVNFEYKPVIAPSKSLDEKDKWENIVEYY